MHFPIVNGVKVIKSDDAILVSKRGLPKEKTRELNNVPCASFSSALEEKEMDSLATSGTKQKTINADRVSISRCWRTRRNGSKKKLMAIRLTTKRKLEE